MRNFLLIVHIASVGAWLGANLIQATLTRRMVTGGGETAADWHRSIVVLGTRYYPASAVLILLSGFGLVGVSSAYTLTSGFVLVGIVVVIIGGAFGGLVFNPGSRRAVDLYESGASSEARRVENRSAGFGVLDTVLLLLTIGLMVARWAA